MVKKRGLLQDFERIFIHSLEFYSTRFSSIVIGFSFPLVLAYAVLLFAQVPSYPALGAVFLRTISIPDLSPTDFVVIGLALIISNFVVADAIANINLLIKRKRTLNDITSEVWEGLTVYATKIFSMFIIVFLIMLLFQLLTLEIAAHSVIYSILLLITGFLLFFTPPAIVIDNEDTTAAIGRSIELLVRSPVFYFTTISLWTAIGLIANTVVGFLAFLILPPLFASYFIILVNCILIYPFLLILQTHIYLEKYPLAK